MRQKLFRLFVAVNAVIILSLAAHASLAHGTGTPQLINVPSGPYLLSVWTDPAPLRADETHVVVGVTDPETQAPLVTGLEVKVSLTPIENPSAEVSQIARADNVNRLLYAAEFNDQLTEGRWRVGVSAAGERGSGNEVVFEVEIGPARGFNWLRIGVGGLAVLILVWIAGSMRRPAPRRGNRPADGSIPLPPR